MIELALFKEGITSLRLTFKQINQHGIIDTDGSLVVQGKTIGLVYYRTGYSDNQYYDEQGSWCTEKWKAREMLECSRAVKCPSVLG
jgi:hypothetical protein